MRYACFYFLSYSKAMTLPLAHQQRPRSIFFLEDASNENSGLFLGNKRLNIIPYPLERLGITIGRIIIIHHAFCPFPMELIYCQEGLERALKARKNAGPQLYTFLWHASSLNGSWESSIYHSSPSNQVQLTKQQHLVWWLSLPQA